MSEEFIVPLADGRTLRSGWSEDGLLGEYVRLCDAEGNELVYWHNDEWKDEPVLVMGAILGACMSEDNIIGRPPLGRNNA